MPSRVLACALAASAACASSAPASPPPGISRFDPSPVVEFNFDSLDDRPLSSDSTRGKPTLLAFVTTGSLPSQAQVDGLVSLSRSDPGANYGVVALETVSNRELVELYAKALSIPFSVAMADRDTMLGAGPLGDVRQVPTLVLLDAHGRVVWRAEGRVVANAEIRRVIGEH